jgi:hypothetical protein
MPFFYNGVANSYTWATKPAASSYIGPVIFSDVGLNGSIWYSNGTKWIHESPIIVAQAGILMMVPSSGSISDNGALTLTTALTTAGTNYYMYFPAGAIAAGSAAGFYYVVMSTTTAGTIYNNTYTGGTPVVPSSLTAFATTGPGAYTQTTGTEITLCSVVIKGGLLGVGGKLDIDSIVSNNSNANSKTYNFKFDSATLLTQSVTTSLGVRSMVTLSSSGSENNQQAVGASSGMAFGPSISTGVAFQDLAINTANDVTVSITGTLANATDYCMVRNFSVVVMPT